VVGIEGDRPARLDDPKFNDYLDRIRRMIRKSGATRASRTPHWHCDYKSRAVIVFGILKTGACPCSRCRSSRGTTFYDDSP